MTELIIYAVIFVILIAHCVMAGKMYGEVHADTSLTIQQRNDWKLKALILPAYFYGKYKAVKN
jgi:hypothetical protein